MLDKIGKGPMSGPFLLYVNLLKYKHILKSKKDLLYNGEL